MSLKWSPEREALLSKLTAEGMEAPAMRRQINKLPGPTLTDQAVRGKVTRLGMNLRRRHSHHATNPQGTDGYGQTEPAIYRPGIDAKPDFGA